MKVFNLSCEHDHAFEGWFSSGEDYDRQQRDQLLQCPVCDSPVVRRLPSAPRLNLSDGAKGQQESGDRQMMANPTAAQKQAMWLKMMQHIQANTEDVGERFPEEARKIHYQEAPERGIRGSATHEQAVALAEEGIEVVAFPLPERLKGPLQ
ncbi:MAG: DUF1178 family protein [Burkholderiaceae bacterium]